MKNLVIGLFIIGFASLGFSQNNGEVEEVQLTDVIVTNVNHQYLKTVQHQNMSNHVKLLENEVSRFDITQSSKFDGREDYFKTKFKGSKGFIVATYNNNGKVMQTTERFWDIKLPKQIIKSILKEYPNSEFLKTSYTVVYEDKKDVDKNYKIQILNNNKKKNLKVYLDSNTNEAISMSIIN